MCRSPSEPAVSRAGSFVRLGDLQGPQQLPLPRVPVQRMLDAVPLGSDPPSAHKLEPHHCPHPLSWGQVPRAAQGWAPEHP